MKQNKCLVLTKETAKQGSNNYGGRGIFQVWFFFIWNVERLQSHLQKHERNKVVFRCLKHMKHLHRTVLDSGVGHQIKTER